MPRPLEDQAGIVLVNSYKEKLLTRCESRCELCQSEAGLAVFEVHPITDPNRDHCLIACETCRPQLDGDMPLDEPHWHCLHDSAWSQVPAVQVAAWQTLKRLQIHAWAQELVDQVYLDEATLAWAEQGLASIQDSDDESTVDSNGARLVDGDTVQIIKDLDVKGTGFVAKRGTIVKNIRLTSNPEHVEGRVNKTAIVLKTCFLKKSS